MKKSSQNIWLKVALAFCVLILLLEILGAYNFGTAVALSVSSELGYGQSLVVSGSGFGKGERVAIWVHSPKGSFTPLGYLTAESDGTISNTNTPYRVSNTTEGEPGTWFLTANGELSKTHKTVSFVVLSPALQLETKKSNEGMTIQIKEGSNFSPGEKISYRLLGQKEALIKEGYFWADSTGRISQESIDISLPNLEGLLKFKAQGNLSLYNLEFELSCPDS